MPTVTTVMEQHQNVNHAILTMESLTGIAVNVAMLIATIVMIPHQNVNHVILAME
jgi:hypothetical protein